MRISSEQGKTKHVQKCRIHDIPLNHDPFLADGEQIIARPVYPHGNFHFWKIMFHGSCQDLGRRVPAMHFSTEFCPVPCFIYAIPFFMKAVIAYFIIYPEQEQHGAGHAYCETCNIDKTKSLIFPEVPESNFEEIL